MSDEHSGQGGSYSIEPDGEKKLIERTKERDEAPPEPPVLTEQVAQSEPADAGFFSPVAPADQSTAE
jgi:hypothetical protein